MMKGKKKTISIPGKKAEMKANRATIADHSEIQILFDKLESLKRLPENWDTYGAKPPNQTAIAAAHTILERLLNANLHPEKIVPSVEHGVAFRFINADRYADIECFNDGDIVAMYMNKDGVRGVFKIDLNGPEIDRAIEHVSIFIN